MRALGDRDRDTRDRNEDTGRQTWGHWDRHGNTGDGLGDNGDIWGQT